MRLKIIVITAALTGILLLTFFGLGLKEKAISGITDNVQEYNCNENSFCTSCMIEGSTCSCGRHTCNCGNKTVDKKECLSFL